ncbi:MAG: hypothetical protein EAZ85_02430 [Bacteroidetes bacterium]|nr:MAG: hypothetical protein EAZ85_02430 [Bacteroidota bacterium]TAG90300.1 MAG: hypothetical protein EAZ20_04750 [Bacteroidota bacterium]
MFFFLKKNNTKPFLFCIFGKYILGLFGRRLHQNNLNSCDFFYGFYSELTLFIFLASREEKRR